MHASINEMYTTRGKAKKLNLATSFGGTPNNSIAEIREICDWIPELEMHSAAEMRVMDDESKNRIPILRDKG